MHARDNLAAWLPEPDNWATESKYKTGRNLEAGEENENPSSRGVVVQRNARRGSAPFVDSMRVGGARCHLRSSDRLQIGICPALVQEGKK